MHDEKNLDSAIDNKDWKEARRILKDALKKEPNHHWLLTRLSFVYRLEGKFEQALACSTKAIASMPRCPLVLWDYAVLMEEMGELGKAVKIYRSLIKRGVDNLSYGECGEGKARAKGLVADCHLAIAECYRSKNWTKRALKEYERHLDMRGPGVQSIVSLGCARKDHQKLKSLTSLIKHG